jgi:hypothetical protein
MDDIMRMKLRVDILSWYTEGVHGLSKKILVKIYILHEEIKITACTEKSSEAKDMNRRRLEY